MKTVLIGVTGCVAIYKTCEIIRSLQKANIRVKVVMTENATHFINPTLFRALTRQPVAVGLFDDAPDDPIHHISLAKEADLFLIAPCTANVIAKLACGIADDLLTTTALATNAPLLIAPAMNVNMYKNKVTQENMETLQRRGIHFIDAENGYLACGDEGQGRLADVDTIVEATLDALNTQQDLKGKKVLITAGPTMEPIDPARCITNRSSGKTGFALAEEAALRGAEVTLITGPVSLPDPFGVKTVHVDTAEEMLLAVGAVFEGTDISIFSAAVGDLRIKDPSDHKLKRGRDIEKLSRIELIENPDIIATMGKCKQTGQIIVGFAAETENLKENAQEKLTAKNADLIVANLVDNGRGFATDNNEVLLVYPDHTEQLPLMAKTKLASTLFDRISAMKTK